MFFSIYFQGKLLIFIIAFKLLSVSSSVSCILLILAKQKGLHQNNRFDTAPFTLGLFY